MQRAQISNWAAPCRHIDEKKNAKRERALSLWFPCSCRCRQRSGRPRFAAKVTLLSLWVGRLQLDNAASAIAKSAKIQARPSWINESARRRCFRRCVPSGPRSSRRDSLLVRTGGSIRLRRKAGRAPLVYRRETLSRNGPPRRGFRLRPWGQPPNGCAVTSVFQGERCQVAFSMDEAPKALA